MDESTTSRAGLPRGVFFRVFSEIGPIPSATDRGGDEVGEISRRALNGLTLLMILGFAVVALHALLGASGWPARARVLGAGVFLGSSCVMLGGLTGFLFGIPRTLQQAERAPQARAAGEPERESPDYLANTNLEQISDWLTKILVGVGLTQIAVLPRRVQQTAEWAAGALSGGEAVPEYAAVYAGSMMVFFTCIGFLFAYLWTRLYLRGELVRADRAAGRIHELSQELRAVTERLPKLQDELEETKVRATEAQTVAIGTGGGTAPPGRSVADLLEQRMQGLALPVAPGPDENDPWKGQFGGRSRGDNRELVARVEPVAGSSVEGVGDAEQLFHLTLTVRSTEPGDHPLTDPVQFFLHPTFNRVAPVIAPGPNGIAELKLLAWGAFTVGALTDGGRTRLELDLAGPEMEAPETFKRR